MFFGGGSSVGSAFVDIHARTDRARGQVVSGFGKMARAAAGAFAAAWGAQKVASFIGDTVMAASGLQEQISATKNVFEDAGGAMLRWSQGTAQSIGVAREEALKAGVGFGNMFINTGLAEGEAGKMARTMVTLAGDMASFNDEDPSDMLIALRAALAGETEPLRRYGVDVSAAAVETFAWKNGIAEAGSELTEQQKVQARYGLVLEQTKKQQGDFARTSDGLANTQRQLAASWQDAKAGIGEIFLPAVTTAVSFLNDEALPSVVDFTKELKGIDTELEGPVKAFADFFREAMGTAKNESKDAAKKIPKDWSGVWTTLNDDSLSGGTKFGRTWKGIWDNILGGWLEDTDDWQGKWQRRWDSWWSTESPRQKGYGRDFRLTWGDALGRWLRDTDDWAQKWRRRFASWWERENTNQEKYAGQFNTTWGDELGDWVRDTDDYKGQWRRRFDSWWSRESPRQKGYGRDFNLTWGDALGKWLRDSDDWKGKWGRRFASFFTNTIRDFRVRLFVLQLAWNTHFSNVMDRIRAWGNNAVDWFKGLPGRLTKALGDVGQKIKDKFKSLFSGFKIPISLDFGFGDGLGIGAKLGQLGGGLLGVSPLSTVGRAYSSMGRPGSVISGFRPGSRTRSGNLSYHARGRALDITPVMAIALAIRRLFGGRTLELITPWPSLNLWHGRPHRYSAGVQADHSGSNAHIHWAMARGGRVLKPGRFLVGEAGAEILNLNRGDMVAPLSPGDRSRMREPAGPMVHIENMYAWDAKRAAEKLREELAYWDLVREVSGG